MDRLALFSRDNLCRVELLSAAVIEKGGKGPLLLKLPNIRLLEVICHND